jgi:methylmalonyl-CoA mutase cobalamin-binding domain/chain
VSNIDKEKEIIDKLKNTILEAEVDAAPEITQKALKVGIQAELLREKAVSEGIKELEEKLYGGTCMVTGDRCTCKVWGHPILFMGMEAARRSLEVMEPILKPHNPLGTVVMGTPQGDVHDLGGKMVAIALTAAGFRVVYLGRDVPPTFFVHKARETGANILAISCYQTTGFDRIKKILGLLTATGIRDSIKVMVGGTVITEKFANEFGLLYARTASDAVKLAKKCIGGN